MNKLDVGMFKEKLLQLKLDLQNAEASSKESAATVVLDQSSIGRLSRIDALQGQQMALETERRRKSQILRVEAALIRIEKGDFGNCYLCGEEMALGRLSFDPTATRCVSCSE